MARRRRVSGRCLNPSTMGRTRSSTPNTRPPTIDSASELKACSSATRRSSSCCSMKSFTLVGTTSAVYSSPCRSSRSPCQRALAALRAISLRRDALNFSARAGPPFLPPSWPSATAAGFFSPLTHGSASARSCGPSLSPLIDTVYPPYAMPKRSSIVIPYTGSYCLSRIVAHHPA